MSRPTAITVRNLSFSYDSHSVLKNVSFEIEPGKYVGVIGPNGGGKTTLLKIILGLLPADNGEIELFGQPPDKARKYGQIGYVPQRATQLESKFPATVLEVVQSGLTGQPAKDVSKADAVRQAMEATQVADLKHRLIYELSGGQRQKVFIARCLVARPKILLLDEPDTGVDAPSKERFYALLKSLKENQGLTILFVTHDVDAIAKEVDQVLCINQKICCHASPEDFLAKHTLTDLYANPDHV